MTDLFLRKLEITQDVNPLKAGLTLEFKKPILFLVGDNGVGKSTILECLADYYNHVDDTYMKRTGMKNNIKLDVDEGISASYIDFHSGDRKYAGTFGEDYGLQISQMKASSGQCTLALFNAKKLDKINGGLVIFDEPCRGLSIKNQYKICNLIYNMNYLKKSQVIVVTHSDIILKTFKDIAQYYLVSEGKDVTYDEYIELQKI